MDCEAFEQLVSEWLDHRDDLLLRARIDAAIGDDPTLREVLDAALRLDDLLRGGGVGGIEPRVRWDRFAARIRDRLDQSVAADTRRDDLEHVLSGATQVDERVDWPRLAGRIGDELRRDAGARRRVAGGWTIFATTAVAAAVILAVMSLPSRSSPVTRPGEIARSSTPPALPAESVVQLSITREPTPVASANSTVQLRIESDPVHDAPVVAAAAEIFLMIDPPQSASPDAEAAGLSIRLN